jgi:uracil-DNA glycosylase family 4
LSPEAPAPGCARCPRLATFRADNVRRFSDHHNAPVPSFGGLDARVLVVGLAPGLHGANRTGRPFTGDAAGDLLYPSLAAHGLASGRVEARAGDGLKLNDCRITNAVRCVPPGNKPTGAEVGVCNGFLAAEIAAMKRLRVILALGAIAHGAVLRALEIKPSHHRFAHGAHHDVGGVTLVDSYHCSRLNTNTGRLTNAMFSEIIQVVALLR